MRRLFLDSEISDNTSYEVIFSFHHITCKEGPGPVLNWWLQVKKKEGLTVNRTIDVNVRYGVFSVSVVHDHLYFRRGIQKKKGTVEHMSTAAS